MEKKPNKTAILFGQTNGFGAVMTALSARNLEKEGYYVPEPECKFVNPPTGTTKATDRKDWGTVNAPLFWGVTFPNYDFSSLKMDDLVVIVNIPIGEDRQRFPEISAEAGIQKITDLAKKGITVCIIDRHKNAVTAYGTARTSGAQIIISSSASTTHYGTPDNFSLFWGRLGAISVRDSGELPVSTMEEEMANAIDISVRKDLKGTIAAILKNDISWFLQFNAGIPEVNEVEPKKLCVKIPKLTEKYGFKQLGAACEKFQKDYAVGIIGNPPDQRILVVTSWKSDALPAAFRLGDVDPGQDVKAFYHPQTYTEERLNSIVRALDVPSRKLTTLNGVAHLERAPVFFEDIAAVMRYIGIHAIPPYLTTHGWPHVENVLCHVRTLSSLYNISRDDQYLLEWSALLHDIGRGAHMMYNGVESDEAQENHEKYSARIIQEWFENGTFQGLLTEDQMKAIVEICITHRRSADLPSDPHIRPLSIILRIADAMDVDKRRARKNDRGQTHEELINDPEMRESSRPHWLGHRAIQSLRIHINSQSVYYELIITNPDDAKGTIERFREEFTKLPAFSQNDIHETIVTY